MSEEQVQIKLVVPISVKESIRTTAKQKINEYDGLHFKLAPK